MKNKHINFSILKKIKNFDYSIFFGADVEFKTNRHYAFFAETNTIYGLPKFDKYSQNKHPYFSIELDVKYYLPSSLKK
jgi:hypothetical protein